MGKKRNRAFSTWTDAELAHEVVSKMSGALAIALEELVHERVRWLSGEQPRKVGLCKLSEKHGGIVILVEREMVGAVYLNDWLEQVQRRPAPHTKEYLPEYKAWLDIRRLAAAAKSEQEQAQERAATEAKGGERRALPAEVDQNVRTY